MNRRTFLRNTTLATGATFALPAALQAQPATLPASSPFYDVRAFGATGDGVTLDSPAINRAIDAAHAAGGGTVYVPPGIYFSGTVLLKSNITLYLEAGAVLQGSPRSEDYTSQQPPRPEGDITDRHLIFARDAENITLTGPGRIDGNGPAYWTRIEGRQVKDEWGDVATYDYRAAKNRPSPMLEFYNCRNLSISRLTLTNAPSWTLRPMNCTDVFIDSITIKNPIFGPNTDGIDPTGCTNVFISNCNIDTADDNICLKSENHYGQPIALSRNIQIINCALSGCCNGIKFGTSTFGGYENILITNVTFHNKPGIPINQRMISAIAIEMVDGGYVDGVSISNVRMQNVRCPLFIRRGNRNPPKADAPNFLRNVRISNLDATGSIMTSSITGLPGKPVEDISLSDIRIDSEESGEASWITRQIPEQEKAYPEARMFGRLPAFGLYIRHAKGLAFRNLELRSDKADPRPAIFADDAHDLTLSTSTAPACDTFLHATPTCSKLTLSSCDLRKAKTPAKGEVTLHASLS